LSHSFAVYGALGPLSCIGVVCFSITRQAVFHVTANRSRESLAATLASGPAPLESLFPAVKRFLVRSHPDHPLVQGIETSLSIFFVLVAMKSFQVSFLGLARVSAAPLVAPPALGRPLRQDGRARTRKS